MRVKFTAFADDSIIRGELLLEGDRLSDFIPLDGPFPIERVTIEALDDARTLTVETASMGATSSSPSRAQARAGTRPGKSHTAASRPGAGRPVRGRRLHPRSTERAPVRRRPAPTRAARDVGGDPLPHRGPSRRTGP